MFKMFMGLVFYRIKNFNANIIIIIFWKWEIFIFRTKVKDLKGIINYNLCKVILGESLLYNFKLLYFGIFLKTFYYTFITQIYPLTEYYEGKVFHCLLITRLAIRQSLSPPRIPEPRGTPRLLGRLPYDEVVSGLSYRFMCGTGPLLI